MAIISAPCLDPSDRSSDWGYYCMGCRDSKDLETHFRNKFTRDGLADHVALQGDVIFFERQDRMVHSRMLSQVVTQAQVAHDA